MAALETTIDAFHRGKFVLVQPKRGGHRAGIDAMLLASCVEDDFQGSLADLGAGAGGAALAVLSRCPKAKAMLFEASDLMFHCAQETLTLDENVHLAKRASVHRADVTARGQARQALGLTQDTFDWVVANPPFNQVDDRKSPHSERSFAHVMDGKTIELWSRTAASITKPGGRFSIILRPESIGELLAAYVGRFGGLRITPILPRDGEDAIRIIATGRKSSKQKLEITTPVILHESRGGAFTARANALINGEASIEKCQ